MFSTSVSMSRTTGAWQSITLKPLAENSRNLWHALWRRHITGVAHLRLIKTCKIQLRHKNSSAWRNPQYQFNTAKQHTRVWISCSHACLEVKTLRPFFLSLWAKAESCQSRWTRSRQICIRICLQSTYVYTYAGRLDEIWKNCFFL